MKNAYLFLTLVLWSTALHAMDAPPTLPPPYEDTVTIRHTVTQLEGNQQRTIKVKVFADHYMSACMPKWSPKYKIEFWSYEKNKFYQAGPIVVRNERSELGLQEHDFDVCILLQLEKTTMMAPFLEAFWASGQCTGPVLLVVCAGEIDGFVASHTLAEHLMNIAAAKHMPGSQGAAVILLNRGTQESSTARAVAEFGKSVGMQFHPFDLPDPTILAPLLQRLYCKMGLDYDEQIALYNEVKQSKTPEVLLGLGGALGCAFGWHPAVWGTALGYAALRRGVNWYQSSTHKEELRKEFAKKGK